MNTNLKKNGYIQDNFSDRSKNGWEINSSSIVDYGDEGKYCYLGKKNK